jgi:hypothetical protein
MRAKSGSDQEEKSVRLCSGEIKILRGLPIV